MDLSKKTAFITGGASGLGLATAHNFASAGANNDETIAIGDSITYRGAGGADDFFGDAVIVGVT